MAGRIEDYTDTVVSKLIAVEQQMDTVANAASIAAERVCSGGRLHGLSDEEGFISELTHRAGGLMLMKGAPPIQEVSEKDVILAATQDRSRDEQRAQMEDYRIRGVVSAQAGGKACF